MQESPATNMSIITAENRIIPATDHDFSQKLSDLTSRAEDFRMENMRRYNTRTMMALILGMISLVAGASGFGWFFLMEGNLWKALASIAAAFILPLILQYWAGGPIRAYRRNFKAQFMPVFAKALGNLHFHPKRGISETIIRKSGILPAFDRYQAEDGFIGQSEGVKLIMSEARLFKGGDLVFEGMFALVEVPGAPFEGTTILTANPALKQALMRNLNPCPVQNPEYAARLAVFTSNSNPPPVASDERLLKEYYEMSLAFENSPLSAIFWNKRFIFTAIPHEGNMFECSNMFVPITTSTTAKQCRREVEQLLSIMDILKLYKS